MLAGFMGKLAGEAIRGLARNLFPGFYERGISANEALRELREAGLGYRRGDFLNDFRADRPGYDLATTIGHVADNYIPREGILKEQYFGNPARYSFVLKANVVDPVSKQEGTDYFTYHRDSLDSKANMQQEALEWFNGQSDTDVTFAYNVSIVEGYINPIWAGGE